MIPKENPTFKEKLQILKPFDTSKPVTASYAVSMFCVKTKDSFLLIFHLRFFFFNLVSDVAKNFKIEYGYLLFNIKFLVFLNVLYLYGCVSFHLIG